MNSFVNKVKKKREIVRKQLISELNLEKKKADYLIIY